MQVNASNYQIHFTVITVCLNSERFIEDTIKSVIQQSYNNYNYSILDGCSTDSTLDIIKKYHKQYPKKIVWKSESDKGLYDAMNKGIDMVTNPESFIIFLNSDDYFYDKDVLLNVSKEINSVDFIYGNVNLLKPEKELLYGKPSKLKDLLSKTICHQAVFCKKEIFNELGYFDLKYKVSADYDFILKVFLKGFKIKYVPLTIAAMRSGGFASKTKYVGCKDHISILFKNISEMHHLNMKLRIIFINIPKIVIAVAIKFVGLDSFRRKIQYLWQNV